MKIQSRTDCLSSPPESQQQNASIKDLDFFKTNDKSVVKLVDFIQKKHLNDPTESTDDLDVPALILRSPNIMRGLNKNFEDIIQDMGDPIPRFVPFNDPQDKKAQFVQISDQMPVHTEAGEVMAIQHH